MTNIFFLQQARVTTFGILSSSIVTKKSKPHLLPWNLYYFLLIYMKKVLIFFLFDIDYMEPLPVKVYGASPITFAYLCLLLFAIA